MRPPGTAEELERRRLRAMTLLDKGMPGVEVAEVLGVTPGAVSQWKK
ncbi:MAG: helix-turn-helix domain-containing protein, partial [Phycisphaerae bacterium]|nr:helix-turn-helix domain-containing protein [Phycisphaerae bacterium]